ncbi:Pre-rRNA-processing protein Esf1 [Gracilaria domingensis]|nr:Pre-rRNA-processing protein Esf1 [Gracilaria domingensis]
MAAESTPTATPKTPNPRKRGRPADRDEARDQDTEDKRFAAARVDPRFSRVPKKAKRHVADQRFKAALKSNPGFRDLETPVDRFGRPKKGRLSQSIQEAVESDDDDFGISKEDDPLLKYGERYLAFDSSDDEEQSDDLIEDALQEGDAPMEVIPLGKATKRLAVMGLDWSTTRAVDIFASLDSFCPPGKHVTSVEVHPSKFGLERLEKEATLGPQVLSNADWSVVQDARKQQSAAVSKSSPQEESDNGSDNGSDSDEEEDEYEEERLKYYYAVVQFADEASADAVYKQCDGVEYAQSGLDFDLRFIPNDMKIETKPRDRANKVPDGYAPPDIASSSLNTCRVKLSWDADDPERVILKKRMVGKREEDEQNLKAYLASSSDEEDGERDQIEEKKRLLLGAIDGGDEDAEEHEDTDMNMQISFEPGMFEKGEEIVKRKQAREEQKSESAWEARMRRRAERKAEKRRARRARIESDGVQNNEIDENGDGVRRDDEGANGFDDEFFSVERSFEDVENEVGAGGRRKTRKGRKERKAKMEDLERRHGARDEDGDKRGMQDKLEAQETAAAGSLLQADESDDEEERRRVKRKGAHRRARRERIKEDKAKSSSVDVKDERFEKMYSSHLFAMDRTHRKFKDNETTQRIMAETMRRRQADARRENKQTSEKRTSSANEELRELAGRLKAKAKAKARTKLQGR